jgi:3-hydroxyisobutyrate dehydrogenase
MGGPMAGHLARAGHKVTLWNRTRSRAEARAELLAKDGFKARIADTVVDAAKGQDVVITCVGNDDDLAEVVLGPDGAIAAMKQGALFIDHTTVSAGIARRIAAEAERIGLLAVDAPVSGGQAGAEKGRLSIMCGGDADAIVDAVPVMQAYGGRIVHVGPPGAGQTTKAVNQICIAGLVQSLAEAIRFAQAAGLDSERVYEAVSGGAAQSWQMVNRWQTMDAGEFDFGFAVDWMRKDLAIALAEAKELGVELPVTELIDGYYAEVQQMGGGRQDTSSLIRRLPQGGAK